MTETTTQAVEKRDQTPAALVAQYRTSFVDVLPSHINPDQWIRVTQSALRRGKLINHNGESRYELEVAAGNNPQAFLVAVMEAARLGLAPGTEEFYLTPRRVKGQLEILGITGYQGIIELMYRAGAVSSVVAEVVYTKDTFTFRPGVDDVPQHEIDWDADDRGELRLVYAFARMKDGATSKVVVLNKKQIADIKRESQGSSSEYSPWVKTEAAMWLKSAVRQLRKWVPTSAEYIREQLRAVRDVAAEVPVQPRGQFAPPVDVSNSAVIDGEVVDHDADYDPVAEQAAYEAEMAGRS